MLFVYHEICSSSSIAIARKLLFQARFLVVSGGGEGGVQGADFIAIRTGLNNGDFSGPRSRRK